MQPLIRRTGLDRKTGFSFTCRKCLQCCRFKSIQVNPYEIARLASALRITTTEFIAVYTVNGGTCLSCDEDGCCVFLGEEGCAVHADRPLVCRLYPLGRHLDGYGQESFSELVQEAGCNGSYEAGGNIGDYVNSQDVAVYIEAADMYLQLLWDLINILPPAAACDDAERAALPESAISAAQLLDMDYAVSTYCQESGMSMPVDINDRTRLHIQVLQSWIKQMSGGDHASER